MARVCVSCGASLGDANRFCPACGAPQPAHQQPMYPPQPAAKKKSKAPLVIVIALLVVALIVAAVILINNNNNPGGNNPGANNPGGNQPIGNFKPNPDGSVDLTIKPGEANGFVYSTKDGGMMAVDIPEGAFNQDVQLNVVKVTSDLEGVVAPGFMVTDKNNPSAHVELKEPATIMFFSETELPRDVMIVKYSDDMQSYEAIPSLGISADFGYFIIAEVDSFSGYAPAKAKPTGGSPDDMDTLVWRIEARGHDIRVREFVGDPYAGNGSRETADANFFLRVDSERVPTTNNNLSIPRTYKGVFDSIVLHDYRALYSESWEWEEDPEEHLAWRIYDDNLTITMIPKLKRDDAAWAEYRRKINEWALAVLDDDDLMPIGGLKCPKPPADLFDGYIGWGTAHIMSDIPELNQMIGAPLAVPIIIRVKNAHVKVSFTYPWYFGTSEMQGTFKGMGIVDAAIPPDLKSADALKYEYIEKPEAPPEPVTGKPDGELKEAAEVGNTKIMLPGIGWIKIIQLFPEGEEDMSLDGFIDLWNTPPQGSVLGQPKDKP